LEKTVASLRRKLQKDSELHRHDNIKVMQENMALIGEINSLRRELKLLKQAQKEKVCYNSYSYPLSHLILRAGSLTFTNELAQDSRRNE
jgi:hypothetical protein